jgi:hypothetical protein
VIAERAIGFGRFVGFLAVALGAGERRDVLLELPRKRRVFLAGVDVEANLEMLNRDAHLVS